MQIVQRPGLASYARTLRWRRPVPPPTIAGRLAEALATPPRPPTRMIRSYQAPGLQTTMPGVAPPATSVGIIPGVGTNVASIPADLTKGPEADITEFSIVSLDAGRF